MVERLVQAENRLLEAIVDQGCRRSRIIFIVGRSPGKLMPGHGPTEGCCVIPTSPLIRLASSHREKWNFGITRFTNASLDPGTHSAPNFRLVEDRDLESMGHDSADYIHLVTESMKLAFADRDAFYGDPAFNEVPIDALMSDGYTEMRRGLIDMKAASQEQQPGDPANMKPLLGVAPQDHKVFPGHSNDTSNCLVADQWGNVVAATPSGWGGVPAGDTGVQLGSRMIGLVTWQDHPSMVQPGKLPRITLTPTLVFKNGKPVFAVSVAGGDQQDQASIQILLNRLVFGFDADSSVKTARFGTEHHINWFGHLPFKPGTLILPRDTSPGIVTELDGRGHKTSLGRPASAAVVLSIDPATGKKEAAAERGKIGVAY